MICGTFTMTGIPSEAEADVIVAGHNSNTPKPNVTKTKAADGTWTVTADYGPCPATTTHSTAGTPAASGP